MSQSQKLKVLLGSVLLLGGTAFILFVSSQGEAILPGVAGSVAILGVAAGALLLGTSEGGRPV